MSVADLVLALDTFVGQPFEMSLGLLDERRVREHNAAIQSDADLSVPHPLLLCSVLGWEATVPEHELREDGTGFEDTRFLPLDGYRLMGGGMAVSFLGPVAVGANLTKIVSLTAVSAKAGRSGEFAVLELRRDYLADRVGRLETHESFIARPR